MTKVTYLDLEYANSHNLSICQIGLVCEDFESGRELLPPLGMPVNPQDGFDMYSVGIHHIHADMVQHCPAFDKLWPTIEPYLVDAIVVGHNVANSDLTALMRNMERYNLAMPSLRYIDTEALAKRCMGTQMHSYKLQTLCSAFGLDAGANHNALADAQATRLLLHELARMYCIDIPNAARPFHLKKHKVFEYYSDDTTVCLEIASLWGAIKGMASNGVINPDEVAYLTQCKEKYTAYGDRPEMRAIVAVLEDILADGRVSMKEIAALLRPIEAYLQCVQSSETTIAARKLNGILKGMVQDCEIDQAECESLDKWLRDSGHPSGYPYDWLAKKIEKILADRVLTVAEAEEMLGTIRMVLNPVEALSRIVYSIEGKRICLTGDFAYGNKSSVAKAIEREGGILVHEVNEQTDMVVQGSLHNASWSGIGKKVLLARRMQEMGYPIQIVGEEDLLPLLSE